MAGAAYMFRNQSGTRIKIVHRLQRRLFELMPAHIGHFVWQRAKDALCDVSPDDFARLCCGVNLHGVLAKPFVWTML